MKRMMIISLVLAVQSLLVTSAGAHLLTVNNGTGGGDYPQGAVVPIAPIVPAGYGFAGWTGDLDYVEDSTSSNTTVTMPAGPVTVTAVLKPVYTLVVNNGTIEGAKPYYWDGEDVRITAIVPSGRTFGGWTSDDPVVLEDPSSPVTYVTIHANTVLTATLVPQYMLSVDDVVSGPFDAGTVVPISATVPVGFRFAGWTGDIDDVADVNNPDTEVTLNSDVTLTTALIRQYTLTVIDGSGSGTYDEGTMVEIAANVPAGRTFGQWTGNTATVDDVNAEVTGVVVNSDITLAFALVPQFQLTVNGGEGSGLYDLGSVVQISADVPAGRTFAVWTGDTATVANVNAPATTVTVNGNVTLSMVLKDQFQLTVTNGAGSGVYDAGAPVPISASVPAGQVFDVWTGDTAGIANIAQEMTTITLTADAVVTATFKTTAPPDDGSNNQPPPTDDDDTDEPAGQDIPDDGEQQNSQQAPLCGLGFLQGAAITLAGLFCFSLMQRRRTL